MEAGPDRIADLLRVDGAAHGPQRRHGAGDVSRRQLGGARDQAEEGGDEVSRGARVLVTGGALALSAAIGIGGLAGVAAQAPPTAAPVDNAAPTAVGPAVGYFEATADLGAPAIDGLDRPTTPRRRRYTLSAGGTNMWGTRDEFQFAWRKMNGDFIIRTHVSVRRRRRRSAPQDRRDHPQGPRGRLALRRRDAARRRPDLAAAPAGGRRRHRDRSSRRDHPRRRPRAEARRASLHHGRWRSSASRWCTPSSTVPISAPTSTSACSSARTTRRCQGNGDLHQRPHRRAAEGGWVPYRDYIGSNLEVMDVATGAPDRAAHVADLDPGAELDDRRQDADLQRQRQAVRFDLAIEGRRAVQHRRRSIRNNNDHVLSFDGDDAGHQQRQPGPGRRQSLGGLGAAGRPAASRSGSPPTRRRTCTAGRPTRSGCSTPASATTSSTSTRSRSTAARRCG